MRMFRLIVVRTPEVPILEITHIIKVNDSDESILGTRGSFGIIV